MDQLKTAYILEPNSSNIKKLQWLNLQGGIEHVYMPDQFIGKQLATVFAFNDHSKTHEVFIVNP
jgi:hypothetical protein